MNQKEYFQISEDKKMPPRCPILNYCSRRAETIYIFSEYNKDISHGEDAIDVLQKNGILPDDFRKKQIHVQGEPTHMIKGNSNFGFSGACPEVNLFDGMNALIPKIACVSGEYDKYFEDPKLRSRECQHYSACPEFSHYQFHQKSNSKGKKRKTIPAKTKTLLQKEINSRCPFCSNEEVGHFQIHHIDDNPENNEFANLLMLCAHCHSKITKGDIARNAVIQMKASLSNTKE